MLLYDRLCRLASASGKNADHYGYLRKAPVYDITNVYSLFDDDWKSYKDSPIPKRPPHEALWAEWSVTYGFIPENPQCRPEDRAVTFSEKYGAFITECPESVLRKRSPVDFSLDTVDRERGIFSYDLHYLCIPWICLESSNAGSHWNGIKLPYGVVYDTLCSAVVAIDTSTHQTDLFSWDHDPNKETLWGLPAKKYTLPRGHVGLVWPPFMAFALLHCKNVSTELIAPKEQTPERLVKRGVPKKRYYRVLRLELPADARPRHVGEESEEEKRKVRFHLCRGHFKNLQHERFKNKGWHWWPAHWKGSKAVGQVDKHYSLHGREEGAE